MAVTWRRTMLISSAIVIAGSPVAAAVRLFSYDPADAETRAAAGPLTFQFRQGLTHTTILNMRSTEATATALFTPSSRRLQPALVGADHDLYEVRPNAEGDALVAALCPGAAEGWMAFSRVKMFQDLEIRVIGAAKGEPPHLCRTLRFAFHGEWKAPPGRGFNPDDLPDTSRLAR